jgi:hypothetical protein
VGSRAGGFGPPGPGTLWIWRIDSDRIAVRGPSQAKAESGHAPPAYRGVMSPSAHTRMPP